MNLNLNLLLKLLPQSHIQESDLALLLSETYLQALKQYNVNWEIQVYTQFFTFLLHDSTCIMYIYTNQFWETILYAPSSSGHSDSDTELFDINDEGQNQAEKFCLLHLHCHLQSNIYLKV